MNSSQAHFPSVAQAAQLLLANFLLQYALLALFFDLRHITGLTEDQTQALVTVLANGIVLVSAMHCSRIRYGELMHATKSSVSATLMLLLPPILLLVPLVLLLDHALLTVVEQVLPLSRWEEQAFSSMVAGSLPAVIATCVLAPVLEEMLFRGILLRAFLNQYPRWAAIFYSALLFGAAHMNVYQFLLALWLGILLGWLYERSRSLLPCIALHAAVNTAVYVLEQKKGTQSQPFLDAADVSTWLAALAAAALGAFVLRRVLVGSNRRTGEAV